MRDFIFVLFSALFRSFRNQAAIQAEIIALRHQLVVLQRTQQTKRLSLHRIDRCLWVWLSQLWSGWRSALIIVKPQTVLSCSRAVRQFEKESAQPRSHATVTWGDQTQHEMASSTLQFPATSPYSRSIRW